MGLVSLYEEEKISLVLLHVRIHSEKGAAASQKEVCHLSSNMLAC